AFDQSASDHGAIEAGRVAYVVEPSELAAELVHPSIVSAEVGGVMTQPAPAHGPDVVGRGYADFSGVGGIPVDALNHIPPIELVSGVEAAQQLPVFVSEAQRRVPVTVPTPSHVEVDQVRHGERTFDHRRAPMPDLRVFPPERLCSLPMLAVVEPLDLRQILVG